MKPKEFDELVRQKFDQNDFEYNPKNWDKLAEELDGRAKKRSVIMWWWMPLAGVAASVALAMGIPGMLRHEAPMGTIAETTPVHKNIMMQQPVQQTDKAQAVLAYNGTAYQATPVHKKAKRKHKATIAVSEPEHIAGIQFHDIAVDRKPVQQRDIINLMAIGKTIIKDKEQDKKKLVAADEAINTFKQDIIQAPKAPRLSVILSGGISRGNQNNGYMAGATIRKMVNDKVFVEGDIAFANSTNTQATQYLAPADGSGAGRYNTGYGAAKTPTSTTTDANKIAAVSAPEGVIKVANVTYNLSYAQVTPCIGYKIMKKMSIAAGPDFQEMLVDNRPAKSTVDKGNLQEAPVFDVGFVGKSEYSVTKNIKAAVAYRKGINSVITPTDKYIDRDYLQFQIKCAIFNK